LSHVPSCIYICGLVMFWICMYTLVCTWHTYALKKSSFDDSHVLRNIELYCLVSCLCVSHNTCTLTSFKCFSWLCFHEYVWALWILSVLVTMWFTYFSWNIFLFYSLLEGFRTSLQVFHLTSCGILRYGRVFQTYYIFQTYFWKPLPSKGGWLGDHALYVYIENHFKHVHEMGG